MTRPAHTFSPDPGDARRTMTGATRIWTRLTEAMEPIWRRHWAGAHETDA